MPAYITSPTTATVSPTPLTTVARWLRATYQAPFQAPPESQSVTSLESYRRSVLLRIISFNVTLALLIIGLPSLLLYQTQPNTIGFWSLLMLIVAGIVSLIINERGAVTTAGLLYLYSFYLATYLYIIFNPFGLDATTLAVYGLINALLFLGGLTCPQRMLLPHCGLVIVISSLVLWLSSLGHAAAFGTTASIPILIAFLDFGYLLMTFLCWLAGRSGRVGMLKLAATLEQEKQLVALKDLFIIGTNHELRTPLMTLSNNLELALLTMERVAPEQRHEMLERALRASKDLKGILYNVLDAGVTEVEVIKHLRMEDVSARALVQQTLDTFDPRELGEPWLEKITLMSRPVSLDIPPDLMMHADSGRTRQVLVNLFSNALKYSEAPTPIAISANLLHSDGIRDPGKPHIQAGDWVQINVRDFGLGIPANEQPLLFTRFVRLARDAASSTRGTGVGLYLSRVLVQAMGGQIWIESEGIAGKGSVFTFILPVAQTNT